MDFMFRPVGSKMPWASGCSLGFWLLCCFDGGSGLDPQPVHYTAFRCLFFGWKSVLLFFCHCNNFSGYGEATLGTGALLCLSRGPVGAP